jgi:hypothetical protein
MAWADALDSLRRYEAAIADGQTQRYIVLSDVLARQLATVLRAAHPFVQRLQDLGEPA